MQGKIKLIIKDLETKKQKVVEAPLKTTIEDLIKAISPEKLCQLVYQNEILEMKKTVGEYNFKSHTVLYICPRKNNDLLSQFIPQLQGLTDDDQILMPILNDLIANQSHLFQGNNPNVNVRISFRNGNNQQRHGVIQLTRRPANTSGNNANNSNTNTTNNNQQPSTMNPMNSNPQIQQRVTVNISRNGQPIRQQTNQPLHQSIPIPTSHQSHSTQQHSQQRNQSMPMPSTHQQNEQSGNEVTSTIFQRENGGVMNVHRYDLTERRQLDQLLDSETFASIIRRSQNEHFEEQYDAQYNCAMLFVQSYLSVLSQSMSRVQLLNNSIRNLLNNPNIVLRQQSFDEMCNMLMAFSSYIQSTVQAMRREYTARYNIPAQRIRNSTVGNEYLEQESLDHEEDIMWRAFEESIIQETEQRDQQILESVMNRMNQKRDDEYTLQNANGDTFTLSTDSSLSQIESLLNDL